MLPPSNIRAATSELSAPLLASLHLKSIEKELKKKNSITEYWEVIHTIFIFFHVLQLEKVIFVTTQLYAVVLFSLVRHFFDSGKIVFARHVRSMRKYVSVRKQSYRHVIFKERCYYQRFQDYSLVSLFVQLIFRR